MALKTFQRKELKYKITKEQYSKLIPKLLKKMDYDKYCVNGSYTVCNIYYDTEGNDVIRYSISKPYFKEKLRLRSYGVPQDENSKVYLELKKKIDGIVNKRRASMTLKEAYDFIEKGIKPVSDNYFNQQVVKEISYYLSRHDVKPALILTYDRIALFDKENPSFRLTFDTNIQTRRTDLRLQSGAYGQQLLAPDEYIMEVKVIGGMPLWLSKAFSELKIARTSFSKYGTEYKKLTLNSTKTKEFSI